MIPVSQPDLGALERRYLLDAFDSGWISSLGPYLQRAEEQLRAITSAPFAAVCSNGTTALHLALLAAEVGPGDEVILPSLTYVATLNAIYYVGATPVVVDVDDDTWCIDPDAVRSAVTSRTAAIIGVDLYGQPANYLALRSIASSFGLRLIADAAESIGASLNGIATGSLAEVTTFSFFGNKVITSGEGGAVATDSEVIHQRILQLRNQGNNATVRYQHDVVGYNYRMTNLSAAVLTAQLERAEELIDSRRHVVRKYSTLLAGSARIREQQTAPGAVSSPWMYSIRLDQFTAAQRNEVISAMSAKGVETRPVFNPVQHMPFVPPAERHRTPTAEKIADEGISLPTYPGLTDQEVERVVELLEQTLRDLD